jgi:PKD repeat protein
MTQLVSIKAGSAFWTLQTSGTATSITLPGTIAAGDTVVVAISVNASSHSLTPPSGWVVDYDTALGTGQRILMHRTMSSGDSWIGTGTTLSWTWSTAGNGWSTGIVVLDGTVYSGIGTIGTFTQRASSTTSTAVAAGDTTNPNLFIFHEKSTSQTSLTPSSGTTLESQMPVTGNSGAIVIGTYDNSLATSTITATTSAAANSNGGGVQIVVDKVAPPAVTPPTAAWTFTTLGLVGTFTDTSTAASGQTITSWAWGFGDGGTSASQNPTHTYSSAGSYTVGLTVTDGDGGEATLNRTVVVAIPTASFTTSLLSLAATFTDTSTAPSGRTITGWAWNFGDSGTSTSQNPTHTYSSAGTYTVTLTVTDSTGATNTTTNSISPAVHTAPLANFSTTAVTTTVTFTSSNTFYDSATLSTQSWDFGDNSGVVTTSNPVHRYMRPGTYSVKYTITDSSGSVGTVTKSVVVIGTVADYWDGTNWHVLKVTEWDGTTEKVPDHIEVSLNTGLNWPQMKASGQPIYVSHRGGSASYVEMTMHAYWASAVLWPNVALEISVQADADGVWWGQHDAYFDRMVLGVSGGTTLPVGSAHAATINTYTQTPAYTNTTTAFREPVAKLTDILNVFGGKRVIFIERKGGSSAANLLNVMDSYGGPNWFVWKQDFSNGLQVSGDSRVSTSSVSNIAGGQYDTWGYYFAGSGGSNTTGDMTLYTTYQGTSTYVGLDYNLTDANLASSIAVAGASRVIGHIIPSLAQQTRMMGTGMRGTMIGAIREALPR